MAPSIFHSRSAAEKPVAERSAPEKPAPTTSFSTDDDLDKVWAEVIIRANKITSWNLDERRTITVDQVLASINPPKDKDESREVKAAAKKVFKNALICVQRFGQFAANTAGMVFGPSQQCFNAISFVISAVQDYDAVFGNITVLMERVSVFMEKLRIYLDDPEAGVKLDKRLRLTVYKVLDHFLTILGLSHKLTKGWKGKLKLAVEIGAFGKDEGIKDAMAKLETLIADVISSEISVIVKELSKAAQDIRGVDRKLDMIAEAQEQTLASLGHLESGQEKASASLSRLEAGQDKAATAMDHLESGQEKANTSLGHLETESQRRKVEEEDKNRIKDISEALKSDVTQKNWVARQEELERRRVPGTGQWLLNIGTFSRWTEVDDEKADQDDLTAYKPRVNAIGIQANEGFGKSYLCSMVVKHLQEKHREDSRTAITYYYFGNAAGSGKRAGDGDGETDVPTMSNTVNRALKAIIYQLASAKSSLGREYAKLIHKICSSTTGGFPRTKELWRKLISDFSKTLDATLFILLDGIDESDGEVGRPLANIIQQIMSPEDSSALKIRLFFTGRPDSLRKLTIDDDDLIPQIKIAPEGEAVLTEGDIRLYVEERLKEMTFFDSENLAQLREQTKDVLSKAVRGDYASLNLKLANIGKSRSVRDVRRELYYAHEDRKDGIERTIGALNSTLDQEDILELNRLLTWEAVCFGDIDVAVYEQYLNLTAEAESFDSLATRIGERFSSVLKVDDGIVTLQAEDIRKYLEEDDEDARVKANEPALQEGEISLMKQLLQRHLGNVFGSDETYQKFGFEDFFVSKLQQKPARITRGSLSECQIKVVQACLAVVIDRYDEEDEFAALHEYAWKYFADHMAKINIGDVDAPTLQDTGRRLVRILWDGDFFERFWSEDRTRDLRRYWVYQTECTDAVFDWMSHPVVQKGLIDLPSERQWVMSVISEGPNIRILEKIAIRMAERWFEQTEDVWFLGMDWLLGYIIHLQGEVPEYVDATREQVEMIEAWCKDTLDNAEEEGRWHSCVARSFTQLGFWEPAAARYRQAVELLPDDWNLTLQLARALGNNKEIDEAVQSWESLITSYQERADEDENFKPSFWDAMFYLISECKVKLSAFEKTKASYNELLSGEWKLKYQLAQALAQNYEIKEASAILEDLIAHNQERIIEDEEFKNEYWEHMLHSLGTWHTQLEEHSKAESIYRKLIEEGMTRDKFEDFAKIAAFYLITTALQKQEKYKESIDLLEELENRIDPEVGTWTIALFREYAGTDDYHERLSMAAIRSDKFSTLVEKYRMAMRSARADSNPGTVLQLQHFLGSLFWADGTPEHQQTALDQWEDIMYQQVPDWAEDINWVWWARKDSSKRLANSLLTLAKEAGVRPMSPEAERYAARLKKLTEYNPAIVRDQVKNVQISLARLYHLAGEDEKAKEVLREYFRLAFKQTEDEDADTRRDGWYRIAVSFQALDEADNALAAWSNMNPAKPGAESASDAANENDSQDTDAEANGDEKNENEENEDENIEESNEPNGVQPEDTADDIVEEAQAEAGAQEADENPEELMNGVHDDAAGDDAGDETQENAEDENQEHVQEEQAIETPLVGILNQSCDGHCGISWTYMGEVENVHSCKDCLDVQFCGNCYAKLQDGTLDNKTCSAKHDFLEYPAFDREKWEELDVDVVVGGVTMKKVQWIDEIKHQWKIDEASLKARDRFRWAVRRIQRAWRLSRWLKQGQQMGNVDLLMRCLI